MTNGRTSRLARQNAKLRADVAELRATVEGLVALVDIDRAAEVERGRRLAVLGERVGVVEKAVEASGPARYSRRYE